MIDVRDDGDVADFHTAVSLRRKKGGERLFLTE
jgi:hypothetical protein